MEALVRSRTMGVTGKKVEKSGIGGRARTMAGAGPRPSLPIRVTGPREPTVSWVEARNPNWRLQGIDFCSKSLD